MKNKSKKILKIIFIIIIVIITSILFFFATNKIYIHVGMIPSGSDYIIRINKVTKKLHVKIKPICGVLDGGETICPETKKLSLKLTTKEYEKIMKIWKKNIAKDDMGTLYLTLEDICYDDKINPYDDNKITYRESANKDLDEMINKMKK